MRSATKIPEEPPALELSVPGIYSSILDTTEGPLIFLHNASGRASGQRCLISIATIAGVANCQETTTVKEVLDAWDRRSQSITAFEATYSLEKVVAATGQWEKWMA
jgi:hypothetical protein